ncbi:MAG TPA: ClpXP protease specificity-enhancing factor [Coxiellaceae bacterium]|nr:ClpXP protease specificity-enhancing factor [Coxiellaceae bacterium]
MRSSRPYFIRAIHEWIVDNALTPHVMVDATVPGVNVPKQHVKDGKIVLNVSPTAVINLEMSNDWVNFDARFSGVTHRIRLPISSITGIYALENGRGMMFDRDSDEEGDGAPPTNQPPTQSKGRPSLKVIK